MDEGLPVGEGAISEYAAAHAGNPLLSLSKADVPSGLPEQGDF
jgi:hypothetical protein